MNRLKLVCFGIPAVLWITPFVWFALPLAADREVSTKTLDASAKVVGRTTVLEGSAVNKYDIVADGKKIETSPRQALAMIQDRIEVGATLTIDYDTVTRYKRDGSVVSQRHILKSWMRVYGVPV